VHSTRRAFRSSTVVHQGRVERRDLAGFSWRWRSINGHAAAHGTLQGSRLRKTGDLQLTQPRKNIVSPGGRGLHADPNLIDLVEGPLLFPARAYQGGRTRPLPAGRSHDGRCQTQLLVVTSICNDGQASLTLLDAAWGKKAQERGTDARPRGNSKGGGTWHWPRVHAVHPVGPLQLLTTSGTRCSEEPRQARTSNPVREVDH